MMRKAEFLAQLRQGLSGLPQSDREERLTFYSEMIEDRMEDGLSEEEAVAAVGAVDEIVAQIVTEISPAKLAGESVRPEKHAKAWEIILLVLGAPVCLSLGIAAVAVIFSLYVSVWAVIVSLWAVFASLMACAVGGILGCVVLAIGGHALSGAAVFAAGVVCAGLSIFLFYGCRAAAKGIMILTKKIAIWIRNCFVRKKVA